MVAAAERLANRLPNPVRRMPAARCLFEERLQVSRRNAGIIQVLSRAAFHMN